MAESVKNSPAARWEGTTVGARIRGLLPSLTSSERRVAEQVLSDPARASASTITELATRSGTSLTTVTRFCRALGLAGYAELRLLLATEVGRAESRAWSVDVSETIAPKDPLERVLASLVDTDTRAIEETAAQLDVPALKRAVALLARARRVDIYAVSGSASVAADLQLRLHHIGHTSFVWSDVHDALSSAALLGRTDVALAVSHSGETREVVEALAEAGEHGAATIAVTNYPRSSVAKVAQLVLTTAARETTFRSGGLSARHAQMLVLDCLYIGVAQRGYRATTTALEAATAAVRDHRLRNARAVAGR